MSLDDGIYKPPEVQLEIDSPIFTCSPVIATLQELSQYAGAAIGAAVVGYPANYAQDASPQMGSRIKVKLDGRVIFRGTIGYAPFKIDASEDELNLSAFDDKWGMGSLVVGQYGIGPAGAAGFTDVGYELVFNPSGTPNKSPAALNFSTGSNAVYWTIKDILKFLFAWYINPDDAIIPADIVWSDAYARVPSNVNLVGQTALQAVDTVVQLAGESWTVSPASDQDYSIFRRVTPGAGAERDLKLFRPRGGAKVTASTANHPSSVSVATSVKDCRDHYQAISGPVIVECTYANTSGTSSHPWNTLLTRLNSFSGDPEYKYRFVVDVAQYAANNLGANLSAGSPPKKWLSHLVTRVDAAGAGYVSAAGIAADPTLKSRTKPIEKPFIWISNVLSPSNMRLVLDGARVDCEHCTIDLKDKVKLARNGVNSLGDKWEENVDITGWAYLFVWATVATVIESVECEETGEDSEYLRSPKYGVIHKNDLSPERRYKSQLPDLSLTSPNATVTLPAGDVLETYVDVGGVLTATVESAFAATPQIDVPVDAVFPFGAEVEIGDSLSAKGRALGPTSENVVTEITYVFRYGQPDELRVAARAIVSNMDPAQFVTGAAGGGGDSVRGHQQHTNHKRLLKTAAQNRNNKVEYHSGAGMSTRFSDADGSGHGFGSEDDQFAWGPLIEFSTTGTAQYRVRKIALIHGNLRIAGWDSWHALPITSHTHGDPQGGYTDAWGQTGS